ARDGDGTGETQGVATSLPSYPSSGTTVRPMSPLRSARFRLFAIWLTRLGLASTYLSGVADRFGAWGRHGTANVTWGDFQHYVARVQTALPHVPATIVLVLAWAATVLDSAFGLGLLIGIRTRTM